jgi:RNA polymerase sigma factor (sigma-70 family)
MLNNTIELSKLWDAVCLGNQEAYGTLHTQLYPGLFSYVRSILKNEEEANDLLQDMFVKLWLKKESIGKIDNVKSYFYTAIRSIALNYIRQVKLRESKLDDLASIIDIQFSAEDIITEKETSLKLKKTITAALNKLPSRQREIIYLRFYESLDYTQIVEVTGIKYQSVVNHIHRAVQSLREDYRFEQELNVA